MPDIPKPRKGSQPGLGRHGASYGKAQRRDMGGGGGGGKKNGCAVVAFGAFGGAIAAAYGLYEGVRAVL